VDPINPCRMRRILLHAVSNQLYFSSNQDPFIRPARQINLGFWFAFDWIGAEGGSHSCLRFREATYGSSTIPLWSHPLASLINLTLMHHQSSMSSCIWILVMLRQCSSPILYPTATNLHACSSTKNAAHHIISILL
jgi:hypothetical protein